MDELSIDYPLPDPAWHYCMVWDTLHQAKVEIDQALAYIKECEVANPDSDRLALASVRDAIAILRDQAVVLLVPDLPPMFNPPLPPDEPT